MLHDDGCIERHKIVRVQFEADTKARRSRSSSCAKVLGIPSKRYEWEPDGAPRALHRTPALLSPEPAFAK